MGLQRRVPDSGSREHPQPGLFQLPKATYLLWLVAPCLQLLSLQCSICKSASLSLASASTSPVSL